MFTGIVRELGDIRAARRRAGVVAVEIEAPVVGPGLGLGDSVAVNGVCLTVTGRRGSLFTADLSPETLRTTTARAWRAGDRVHLEPSLRANDSIGGHFVLGHVDGVGRVTHAERIAAARQVTVGASPHLLEQLLPKGSIAVDGVSLTLDAGPFERSFTVTLIPQTLRETRFAALRVGAKVNLELDVLAKAIRGRAQPGSTARSTSPPVRRSPLTIEDIRRYGWHR